METLYALDFVSLLLSKETPRQAEISMSQHLRQSVPIGSLGVGIIRQPQPSGTEKRDAKLVSQGWKLQGLTSAADSLLRSATRLEIEMEQETRYWEQVLAVKEQGWSICRLPRDRHTLGVRYGFAEGKHQHVSSFAVYTDCIIRQLLLSSGIVAWPLSAGTRTATWPSTKALPPRIPKLSGSGSRRKT